MWMSGHAGRAVTSSTCDAKETGSARCQHGLARLDPTAGVHDYTVDVEHIDLRPPRAGLPAKIVAFARGEFAQTRFRLSFQSK